MHNIKVVTPLKMLVNKKFVNTLERVKLALEKYAAVHKDENPNGYILMLMIIDDVWSILPLFHRQFSPGFKAGKAYFVNSVISKCESYIVRNGTMITYDRLLMIVLSSGSPFIL